MEQVKGYILVQTLSIQNFLCILGHFVLSSFHMLLFLSFFRSLFRCVSLFLFLSFCVFSPSLSLLVLISYDWHDISYLWHSIKSVHERNDLFCLKEFCVLWSPVRIDHPHVAVSFFLHLIHRQVDDTAKNLWSISYR